jgi:DNA-binding transcriptional LysR family regulator
MAERPTLRQLEILEAVLADGGFRGAARRLGISQVAISDHVRQLESRLGVALFERMRGGRAVPTAAADRIRPGAAALVAESDRLVQLAREGGSPLSAPAPLPPIIVAEMPGAVRIGAHQAIFSRFQEALEAFEDAFPDRAITLDLDCFTAERVATALAADRIDLAFFYTLGEGSDVPSTYLWSEKVSLFIGRDHPLAARDLVGRDDLGGVPRLTLAPGNALRPLIDALAESAGLAGDAALASDDYAALLARVRAGEGVLPLFGSIAAQFGGMAGVRRLPFADPLPTVAVRRAIRAMAGGDPVIEALATVLGGEA